jgi:hypothetical protein
MTGRERALRCLNLQPTDRIPILAGFAPHPEFLTAASERSDFWEHPQDVAIEAYRRVGGDFCPQLVLPGSREDFRGDTVAMRNRMSEVAREYPDAESVVRDAQRLPSREQVRREYDHDAVYASYVRDMKAHQQRWGDMLWLSGYGQCNFMFYGQYGYRAYFEALSLYPDDTARLFEHSAEQGRLFNEVLARAIPENDLPPFVYGGQDICDNRGPMVSPELLDRIYFPFLKHSIEPLLDAGIKIVWHCDGNIMPILDILLDCGMEGFQGFQEEAGVELEKMAALRTRSGSKPILWGSVSVTTTLPHGTTEDVRRAVERCIDILAPGGGFALAPTSSVCPEVPVENIFTLYEHGIAYGALKCQQMAA